MQDIRERQTLYFSFQAYSPKGDPMVFCLCIQSSNDIIQERTSNNIPIRNSMALAGGGIFFN